MPNINDVVGFKYGSQSEYDGRSVDGSDVNNLFFTTDTKRMYVGPEEYTRPVMSGDSVPSFSATPMSLFIRNVSSSGVEGTLGYTPAHKEVYYNSSGSSGDWVLVVSGNTGTVRYDIIQSLSDEQKVRARDNIGALASDHGNNQSNPHSVTKSQVGLGNVDNTSDSDKPVSAAQASAIADAKKAGTDAQSSLLSHTGDTTNPHKVTASQVGADAEGTAESKVSSHNTSTESHADIRNSVIDLKGQVLEAKTKLDGIENGANKTVVDSALSSTSTNPVQNKVIKETIDSLATVAEDESLDGNVVMRSYVPGGSSGPVVDDSLSVRGAAADAKAVGDWMNDVVLSENNYGTELPETSVKGKIFFVEDTEEYASASVVATHEASLGDAWTAETSYAVGDYCISGNRLYKCKTDHTSGSTFSSEYWETVSVASEIKSNTAQFNAYKQIAEKTKKFFTMSGSASTATFSNVPIKMRVSALLVGNGNGTPILAHCALFKNGKYDECAITCVGSSFTLSISSTDNSDGTANVVVSGINPWGYYHLIVFYG